MENIQRVVNNLSAQPATFGVSCGLSPHTMASGMAINRQYVGTATSLATPTITSNANWHGGYAWWPTYWPTNYEDRIARAFRVVKLLMDRKAVNLTKIKQLTELVDELVKVL